MRARIRLPLLAAAAALLITSTAAQAQTAPSSLTTAQNGMPPQVLGLVAHATPIPLTCEDGSCTALVSSFCLQEDRPAPGDGQRYQTAGAGDVTLVVRKRDGSVNEFSAAGLIDYESEGHFTRTRVSMDASRLASLDAAEVAVRIAPMVSLIPVTEDPVAQAVVERDMETALGAPRFVAERFFAAGTPRADAAVTMTHMINFLPAAVSGGVDPNAIDPTKREALWNHVTTSGAVKGLSVEGIERARGELERCGQFADMGIKLTLRGCLESSHDHTMREVNDAFWDAEVGY